MKIMLDFVKLSQNSNFLYVKLNKIKKIQYFFQIKQSLLKKSAILL
jgi:hypothetical protein